MKILVATLMLMLTAQAHAGINPGVTSPKVINCEIRVINDTVPQNASSVTIDTDQALLEFNRGSGPETLLGKDSIYFPDVAAIWFDRLSECTYTHSTPNRHIVHHVFNCSAQDITADVSLTIDGSMGGGTFKSILSAPNMPPEEFSFRFSMCHRP